MPALNDIRAENTLLLAGCRYTAIVPALRVRAMTAEAGPYREVSAATGVPMAMLAALNERESSTSMHTYLGNGDPLDRRTVDVPRGRGPFGRWIDGAEDALHLDGLDQYKGQWDWPLALALAEHYNGYGYRMHGLHSAYVWAGTSLYTRGKYDVDSHWVPDLVEHAPGVALLLRALHDCGAEWQIPGAALTEQPAPGPVPDGYTGHPVHGVLWVQSALNSLIHAGLKLDGSYGARTRAAVREYQQLHGLHIDGIAGPVTISSLDSELTRHVPAAAQAAQAMLLRPASEILPGAAAACPDYCPFRGPDSAVKA